MRQLSRISSVVLLVAGVAVGGAGPARAQSAICGTAPVGGGHSGYHQTSDTFSSGTGALIRMIPKSVCDSDHNVNTNRSIGQVLVKDASGHHAQAGYVRGYGGNTYMYTAGTDVSTGYHMIKGTAAATVLHVVDADTGYVNSLSGCQNEYPSATDWTGGETPGANVSFYPYHVCLVGADTYQDEFYGWVDYNTSDVPGQPTNHAEFFQVGYYTIDGMWNDYPCGMSSTRTNTKWSYQSWNCHDFDVWTATE